MPHGNLKYHTDEELIEAIKNKDQAAFHFLYDTYSAPLLGLIVGITQDLKLSEDILRKTFILVWQNITDYQRSNQRFFTWTMCLARKLAKESHQIPEINDKSKIHSKPNSVSEATVLAMICLKGYSLEAAAKELNMTEQEVRIMFKNELHHYKTEIVK
jgi:DNA-directed RNA polymerase specialized sigma24 family protein